MNKTKSLKKIKKNYYGYYLTLDLYDCEQDKVGNLKIGYFYLDKLPDLLNSTKLSPPIIIYTDEKKYPDKAGLSGWIPIMNSKNKTCSGISIHTLTPTNFISIDIYSCRKFSIQKIKKFTIEVFKPQKIEEQYILRGEKIFYKKI